MPHCFIWHNNIKTQAQEWEKEKDQPIQKENDSMINIEQQQVKVKSM